MPVNKLDVAIYRKTHWVGEIKPEMDGREVTLSGWVWDIRDVGRIKFIVLRDREGMVQVTVKRSSVSEETWNVVSKLAKEDVISVKGVVKASKVARAGVEVEPIEVKLLNKANPLPIDIWGNVDETMLDLRLRYRVVDLKRRDNVMLFKAMSEVVRAMRNVLYGHGFIEVFTPKIIATSTEGGAELFPVQYFERTAYLAQSPQLYKEELTASLERVFEIGPAYRAEKHDTTYHVNEFISVDAEAAFMDYRDVMGVLEDVVIEAYRAAAPILSQMGREVKVPVKPFKVITYDEALSMLDKEGVKVKWGDDIPKEGLEKLSSLIKEPFFIIHFPTMLRAFYTKPIEGDETRSESFDLVIDGMEVTSGSTRIHDRKQLEEAMKARGLNPENFAMHLEAYDWGMPPHAGWGLGLYRLMMVMAKVRNIREVILFPRDRYRLTP